jgi:hypothetical protein
MKTKTKEKTSPIYSTHTHFRKKPKNTKRHYKFPKPSAHSHTPSHTTEHHSSHVEDDATDSPEVPEDTGDDAFEEATPEDDLADVPVDESAPMET